jgi:potassium-dependent mechanosensitive channel
MEKPGYASALPALLLILVLSGVRPASAQTLQTETPAIATPQIGAEAIQLDQRIRTLPDRLLSAESLANLENQTNRLSQETGEKARLTESAIQAGALPNELQQSSLDWNNLKKQAGALSQDLTRHATALEKEIESLEGDETRWSATRKALKVQTEPSELLGLTEDAVADIRTALMTADKQRGQIASLQQLVANQSAIVATEIEHLTKALEESQRSLLEPDSLPLWNAQFGSQPAEGPRQPSKGTYSDDVRRLRVFIHAHRKGLAAAFALALLALVFLVRLKRAQMARAPNADGENHNSVTQRPFALALLILLVALMPMLRDAPSLAIGLAHLIGIIPVVRLLKPRLERTNQQKLIAIILGVLSWLILKTLPISTWVKRDVLALFVLLAIGVFIGLARKSRRDVNQPHRSSMAFFATSAGLVLLILAFLANVFGYVRLSDLLAQGALASAYRGTVYYTLVVIGSLFISFVLREKAMPQPAAVLSDRVRLSRRLSLGLSISMLLFWLDTTLSLFAVRTGVYTAMRTALDYPIQIGSFKFATSNMVAFGLTLAIGYLVASVTRLLLGEEILPRLKLAYGITNAIATVTHYVVLVAVFLLAIAAAGVELSKFSLMTGALGVGLGFGLQNIVNNFVSGLILLFERPVRLGDLVEVGGVGGKVSKIGVRSSTLRASDGSDLIIPNANLISERVVNRTLGDTRSQILLNIPIAYGTDPNEARDVLSATVTSHREVLRFPGPTVFFTGFGDSALNFEVRFWAPHPEAVSKLKSDVALRIAAALSNAGIRIPMPQRVLHIDPSESVSWTGKGKANADCADRTG